jgi:hypothetical protein
MTEIDLASFRLRLDALERQNRRLRRVLGAASVAVFAVVAVGATAPAPRVIEAEQVLIRDANGRTRAILGLDPASHSAGLAVLGASGARRIGVGVKSDGTAGIALSDERGELRAGLATTPAGKASVSLSDETGSIRAGLGVVEDGTPRLGLTPPEEGS